MAPKIPVDSQEAHDRSQLPRTEAGMKANSELVKIKEFLTNLKWPPDCTDEQIRQLVARTYKFFI